VAISYIENIQNNSDSSELLTWKKLHRFDAVIPVPFQLTLTDSKTPLQCNEIIRIIPKKRLVAFGLWNNKPVVAKLFYERRKRAKYHCEQDVQGINALMAANIPTPKLFYHGTSDNQRIQVLLFEKITPSYSLDEIWQGKVNIAELIPLMRGVMLELATQHVLGILQHDLHLKNFLIAQKKIYTLDGGGIEKCDTPLDKQRSLENLGLFFAQLGVGTEQLRKELFKYYAELRSWIVKKSDIVTLETAITKSNQQRWRQFQKKIFRNCTAFKNIKTLTRFIMFDQSATSPEFLQFLHNPDIAFKDKNNFLKAGRTSSVAKITINNRIFVVKRYNIKNTWHWLRRCFRSTRAVSSWRLAQRLHLFGISTPKPIACIENRFLGLRGKSYFVMDYVEGQHLGKHLANNKNFSETAKHVVMLLNNLSELQITHGDLKMTNILISNHGPYLIDLDGMTEHTSQSSFKRAYKQELIRFMQNWKNSPDIHTLFDSLLTRT
jgi:tRNA A-37 threonylcarbamoyl transferase component Bud32